MGKLLWVFLTSFTLSANWSNAEFASLRVAFLSVRAHREIPLPFLKMVKQQIKVTCTVQKKPLSSLETDKTKLVLLYILIINSPKDFRNQIWPVSCPDLTRKQLVVLISTKSTSSHDLVCCSNTTLVLEVSFSLKLCEEFVKMLCLNLQRLNWHFLRKQANFQPKHVLPHGNFKIYNVHKSCLMNFCFCFQKTIEI